MHPVLVHFGHFSLPTFGVLAAAGLLAALGLSERAAALARVSADKLWDAGLFAVMAAFVLSRVLLVATNFKSFVAYPLLLLAVPSLTASGLLLTMLAMLLWLRWKGLPLERTMNAWAPSATLLWAFLALGHFAEGSDPGMATGLPWGVRMPGEATPLHPVALYVFLFAWGLTVVVYRRVSHGDAAATALVGAGAGQFLLSFVRQPGVEMVAGLDVLQWVALGMMVAGGTVWLMTAKENGERIWV